MLTRKANKDATTSAVNVLARKSETLGVYNVIGEGRVRDGPALASRVNRFEER